MKSWQGPFLSVFLGQPPLEIIWWTCFLLLLILLSLIFSYLDFPWTTPGLYKAPFITLLSRVYTVDSDRSSQYMPEICPIGNSGNWATLSPICMLLVVSCFYRVTHWLQHLCTSDIRVPFIEHMQKNQKSQIMTFWRFLRNTFFLLGFGQSLDHLVGIFRSSSCYWSRRGFGANWRFHSWLDWVGFGVWFRQQEKFPKSLISE